ncbi:unnamed protein product [Phytophthora fragariaefolia]|uniref:Unnamed protein product n=1 Tax=Phytophthora fragariaefolia TaxID=1490495 RepID=A0A9W6U4N6_9STRA|nr:unnamed protein product [Phytophthora fragariaefolia]
MYRLEIYCGTDQHTDELGGESPTKFSVDPNSAPAAVIRNLHEVLPPPQDGVFHAVVPDRFYKAVQLALQLLARIAYTVGTIQKNKTEFPPALIDAARPADFARGSSSIATAKCCPQLQLMRWWGRLPVYLLSTGSSSVLETCG